MAVFWFTATDNIQKVNLVFSDNSSISFNKSIQIDGGKLIVRADVSLLDEDNDLVSWMESTTNEAEIKVLKVNKDGTKSKSIVISKISASRASEFPLLEWVNGIVYVAWNNVEDDKTSIKMKIIDATILN